MSTLLESFDSTELEDALPARERRILESEGFEDLYELVEAASRGANFKTFEGIGKATHDAIYEVANEWNRNTTLNQLAEIVKGGDRFRRIARSKGLYTARDVLDYYADGGQPLHVTHKGFGPNAEVECLKAAIGLAKVDESSTVDDG
jgi:hypothetical protein